MKPRILISMAFLLCILGIESLKKEQLNHFWHSFSGLTFPIHKSKQNQDLDCTGKKSDSPVAEFLPESSLYKSNKTCHLLFSQKSRELTTCKYLMPGAALNTNIL